MTMTGRSVNEWRGSSPDAAIPKSVRLRVWTRCEGKCAITGRKLQVGDAYDIDHIIPLALGGDHAEHNLQLVSKDGHKAKTADDVKAIRKADRVRSKHLGIKTPKPGGFRTWRNMRGEIVKRGER